MSTAHDAPALLSQPFRLPCGAVLPNRLAKAAMAEGLADPDAGPSEALVRLYDRWARGGAGMLLTGNVMVDPSALGEPRDVVIEDERHLDRLRAWAEASTRHGVPIWMQINHPGRQSMSPDPVAPSAVAMDQGFGLFQTPRALENREIEALVARFATTAAIAKAAGFSGVQLHAAHGYLISQFLSPRTNQRTDSWGGNPENRRRFLLALVRAVRAAVGPGFPVSVKLNSADFQKGGFSEDESLDVVRALAAEGIDLLEISGGTYESAAMMGIGDARASTRAREAYFLDYASRVRQAVPTPVMLTGGFRTAAGMAGALGSGDVDMVGLARPLSLEPDLPRRLLAGTARQSAVKPQRIGIRQADGMVDLFWHQAQIHRMGEGREPDPERNPWFVMAEWLLTTGPELFRRRRR